MLESRRQQRESSPKKCYQRERKDKREGERDENETTKTGTNVEPDRLF